MRGASWNIGKSMAVYGVAGIRSASAVVLARTALEVAKNQADIGSMVRHAPKNRPDRRKCRWQILGLSQLLQMVVPHLGQIEGGKHRHFQSRVQGPWLQLDFSKKS
jgi:hypothetical protein